MLPVPYLDCDVQRVANAQEEPGLPSGELQSGPAGIPAAGKDLQG